MKKSIIALFLAFTMLFSVMAGCTNDNSSSPEKSSNSSITSSTMQSNTSNTPHSSEATSSSSSQTISSSSTETTSSSSEKTSFSSTPSSTPSSSSSFSSSSSSSSVSSKPSSSSSSSSEPIITYLITFKNGNSTLQSTSVKQGEQIVYNGQTPTKQETQDYTYTFAGWSETENGATVTLGVATKETTYYAVFTPVKKLPYSVKSGNFTQNENVITSTSGTSLAIKNNQSFASGTLSANVTITTTGADNGLVFRVTNTNNLETYWEANVSYYFFFLAGGNQAYLGKVTNGAWGVCQTAPYTITNGGIYTLSVSVDESTNIIRCFVNGVLQVSYKDEALLSGTEYGVRAGKEGIVFDNLTTTSTITGNTISQGEFYTANGNWTYGNNTITSSNTNSIAVKQNEQYKYGTLETTIKLNGTSTDNGLIFGLSNDSNSFWERSGVSYYFFFIAVASGNVMIAKTDNGNWTHFANKPINNFSSTGTYTLKVERNSQLTYLYVNDTLYLTLADTSLQGTGFGVRAGGSGISFNGLTNLSGFENVLPSAPENFNAVLGGAYGSNDSFVTSANSIALYKTALNKGTFSVNIAANTNQETGVVFNYKDANNYYRFYTQRTTQTVKVAKRVNGVESVIYTNYLSAGYSESGNFLFSVVLTNNKAYCHFFNTRYAVIDCDTSSTSSVGVFAQGNSALFTNFTASTSEEVLTVDTLLFGHSYFELWNNWKTDLAGLNLGTYTNIGIGGSVASHWYNFKDSILTFKPKQVIYMIGINDLTAGVSPENTTYQVRDLLLYLKENIPNLNVILLGVNHCPARYTGATHDRKAEVIKTNELYKQLVLDYDSWINFVELEHAFSDSNQVPLASYFTDGLHPTAGGYVEKIVPGIQSALKGENQPVADPSQTATLLASAKQIKIDGLSSYNENGFRATEWISAKPIYQSAINAINACATRSEVVALDLSTYISQLDAIKHNGDYFYTDILNETYVNNGSYNYSTSVWETYTFTNNLKNSSNGTFLVGGDGHRLNDSVAYTDMDFKFKVSNNTGPTDVFGVLALATQNSNLGINGYMINVVTEPNYIQVWYFNNAWGLNGTGSTITYIGGWVFPGEVENTLFRAIIKDGFISIYTEEDYQKNGAMAYGCRVDLTNNGAYALYKSGYSGIISWKNNTSANPNFTAKLYLGDICGSVVKGIENAQTVTSNIISNTNCQNFMGQNYTAETNGFVNALGYSYSFYNGITASDFTMVVDSEALTTGVGLAGFLFRTKKNATNNGIDGYILNFVANENDQFIQVLKLDNYYSTDGSSGTYKYMGGWVYSASVNKPICGQHLVVTVKGNTFTISTQTESISFGLNGDQINTNDPVHASGGFGFVCWQENFNMDLQIKSITI